VFNSEKITTRTYVDGILAGDRAVLARAITLIESQSPKHREQAENVLMSIMPNTGHAKRLGITGVPGVGKSTFIDALGCQLCDGGHRVAILAIDPTSPLSGGSILGDKTRMERLSQHANAFIRPSATGTVMGGVARKTREAMYLCEAAGYDVIMVETVGVGQSEIAVRSMVDFFLLMLLPGGGDELQGIKKGIVEMADALFINKADGSQKDVAEQAQREYASALAALPSRMRGWQTNVYLGSARTGLGLADIWAVIEKFFSTMGAQGNIEKRRQDQMSAWFEDLLNEELKSRFFTDEVVKTELARLSNEVVNKRIGVSQAVQSLMSHYEGRRKVS
jgi:LAO/AO transport system kinase